MPLAEHLRELRNRLAKAMLVIVVVTVVAAFFYNDIIDFITQPILDSVGCEPGFSELAQSTAARRAPSIAFNGLLAPFTLALKVALMAGVVVARRSGSTSCGPSSRPACTGTRRSTPTRSSATGVPLFLGGAYFAYWSLPTHGAVLLGFTPDGIGNLLPLDDLLDLVMRMVLVFGLSFELPLLLVMLNLAGVLTGKRMLGWWRGMIMGITVFAAVATPSTDPITMLALAGADLGAVLRGCRLLAAQRPPQGPQRRRGTGRRRGLRPGPHPRGHRRHRDRCPRQGPARAGGRRSGVNRWTRRCHLLRPADPEPPRRPRVPDGGSGSASPRASGPPPRTPPPPLPRTPLPPSPFASSGTSRVTPVTSEITLFVNPTAGRGQALRSTAGRCARARGRLLRCGPSSVRTPPTPWRGRVTPSGRHRRAHRRRRRRHGDLALQAVGRHARRPLGVVAVGTGNDFARALGPARARPRCRGPARRRGARRATGRGTWTSDGSARRWFGTVLASGFDSRVNDRGNRMRWPAGRLRYDLAMVAELAALRPMPYRIRSTTGRSWRSRRRWSPSATGPRTAADADLPGADSTEGLFDVTVVGDCGRYDPAEGVPSRLWGARVGRRGTAWCGRRRRG